MLSVDGTAHGSLLQKICIVETLSTANLREIAATSQPFAQKSLSLKLPQATVEVSHRRTDAFIDLNAYYHDNWDCDGAIALTRPTVDSAKGLLESLPAVLPNPDVAPASDGSLCMEWNKGDDLVWADVESDGSFRTLVKIGGRKRETIFGSPDKNLAKLYLANALARMYS